MGELQRFTPTIEALVTPDIDASLDEQAAKTRLLERLQGARCLVGRAAAVLTRRRAALGAVLAALAAWDAFAAELPEAARPLGRRP